jgi:hypothetical protein
MDKNKHPHKERKDLDRIPFYSLYTRMNCCILHNLKHILHNYMLRLNRMKLCTFRIGLLIYNSCSFLESDKVNIILKWNQGNNLRGILEVKHIQDR